LTSSITWVFEENKKLEETKDEDGFSCEDVAELTEWIKSSFARLVADERYDIKAVNFSAYGASLFISMTREK